MADIAVRRLVALLGHLTPGAKISISQLADLVGTTEATLAADLTTLSMCGVAPFYPDDYMPLIIEDGYVEVFGDLPALTGTVRLSPAESAALAAALQVAGFPADHDLTSRLLDASASTVFDPDALAHTIRTLDAGHSAAVYQTLAKALAEHGVLRIEYVRAGSEETTLRDVEPTALFAERGAWYLNAWCRSAGDWRVFRIDRVRSAQTTGEVFNPEAREGGAGTTQAFPAEGMPTATLKFAPGEAFEEREWPGARVVSTEPDGSTTAEVPYGGSAWIARHVVARLGRVEVLQPAEIRSAVARVASEELAKF